MRYLFFGIFEIYYLYSFLFQQSYIGLYAAVILAFVFFLVHKTEKTKNSTSELTSGEKVQVIITELLLPIIAGAFYYYCWKNKLPKKASQANKYSILTFLVWIGIVIIILFSVGFTTYNDTKNKAEQIRQQNSLQK